MWSLDLKSVWGSAFIAACLCAHIGCGSGEQAQVSQQAPQQESGQPARAKSSTLPVTISATGAVVQANVGRLEAMTPPPTVAMGRPFTEEEHRTGNSRVVLVSHSFWAEDMQADPAAVGKQVEIGRQAREIIGVLAESSELSPEVEVWLPRPSQ